MVKLKNGSLIKLNVGDIQLLEFGFTQIMIDGSYCLHKTNLFILIIDNITIFVDWLLYSIILYYKTSNILNNLLPINTCVFIKLYHTIFKEDISFFKSTINFKWLITNIF